MRKEPEEFNGEECAGIKRALQTVFKEAKEYHGHGIMEDVEKLHRNLTFFPDSQYEHAGCRKFVKNLLKRKREWLFQFVMNPHVEPTNNRAERCIRPSVIYRKTSGGSRTERVVEIYTRIYSIYYTSKLRGKNFITDTSSIIKGNAKPG